MPESKKLRDSYLLSLLSFVGFAGIHRFYLGKPVSGFFYLITMGFAGFGTLYDLIFMPRLVDEANRRLYIERQLNETYERAHNAPDSGRPRAQSLEHLMFILAKENQGILSAAQLALESGIQAEQAQDELDRMVSRGQAMHGQRKNGLKVYVFQEFLTPHMRTEIVL